MRLVAVTDGGYDETGTFQVVDILRCEDVLPSKYIHEGLNYGYLPQMYCLNPE